jgi:hypothetical protein
MFFGYLLKKIILKTGTIIDKEKASIIVANIIHKKIKYK